MNSQKQSVSRFETAYKLTSTAGELIISGRKKNNFEKSYKEHNELVTSIDQQIDDFLISELKTHFPRDNFLTEESYHLEQKSSFNFSHPTWIIDPIDGTVNFAFGHPQVAISIAFVENNQAQFGIVHCPFLGETFHAIKGQGAYLNTHPIKTAECSNLSKALVATGLPYDKSKVNDLIPNINAIITHARDIRRNGSAAIDLCWVACGRLQAYFETVQPWDMAAGRLIANEAGAHTGHYGKFSKDIHLINDLQSMNLLVCSPQIKNQLLQILK